MKYVSVPVAFAGYRLGVLSCAVASDTVHVDRVEPISVVAVTLLIAVSEQVKDVLTSVRQRNPIAIDPLVFHHVLEIPVALWLLPRRDVSLLAFNPDSSESCSAILRP